MKRGVYSKAGPVGANRIVLVGPIVDHRRPHDRERFRGDGRSKPAGRRVTPWP